MILRVGLIGFNSSGGVGIDVPRTGGRVGWGRKQDEIGEREVFTGEK